MKGAMITMDPHLGRHVEEGAGDDVGQHDDDASWDDTTSMIHEDFSGGNITSTATPTATATAGNANDCETAGVSVGQSDGVHQQLKTQYEASCPPTPPSYITDPIVVGYAFGPKKMSTMGLVLAEASKTRLQTSYLANPNSLQAPLSSTTQAPKGGTSCVSSNLTHAVLYSHSKQKDNKKLDNESKQQFCTQDAEEDAIVFAMQDGNYCNARANSIHNSVRTAATGTTTISTTWSVMNVVRRFHSTGSVGGESTGSTGTCTASTATTSIAAAAGTSVSTTTTTASATAAAAAGGSGSDNYYQYPIRVSFVPLDLNSPLEDQHGGKLDVILHKLTEDILCLSRLSSRYSALSNLSNYDHIDQVFDACDTDTSAKEDNDTNDNSDNNSDNNENNASNLLQESERSAIQRVHRLCQFHKKHPECSLVDHPVNVQTLMSRADIYTTLQSCLKDVCSTTGMEVSCPQSTVLLPEDHVQTNHASMVDFLLHRILNTAKMSFPIIVKPLTAAGTKESHAMAILLNADGVREWFGGLSSESAANTDSALSVASRRLPCLCQEYSNHDGVLYKVYVMGHDVSVYKRRSLPNLPPTEGSSIGCVAFDSQRPYPKLSDFGFDSQQQQQQQSHAPMPSATTTPLQNTSTVTVEEVMPIVQALKRAFGLELFGFDILVANSGNNSERNNSNHSRQKKMLVVDVNYFPSYKETTNLPAQLAKYLADRALDGRIQKHNAANKK